jgi:hypothetical protein
VRFRSLLEAVGGETVFETGLLLAGDVDAADVRRQLSRWVASGRLFKLRRGLYALAPPWRSRPPHPFVVANRLVAGSYVSLQSALAHHGLIPEYVPVTTSVSLGRPCSFATPLGSFEYRHVTPALFFGFGAVEVSPGESALVASATKALADLVHLVPAGDARPYLDSLRLQNLGRLEAQLPPRLAARPKLRRAFRHVEELAREETGAAGLP